MTRPNANDYGRVKIVRPRTRLCDVSAWIVVNSVRWVPPIIAPMRDAQPSP